LMDTPGADPALGQRLRETEDRIQDLMIAFYGDWTKMRRSDAAPPSLMPRVSARLNTTSPITETVKHSYEIAAASFNAFLDELRQAIDTDLKKIGEEMEAAGAPWTPGRGVPGWKKQE